MISNEPYRPLFILGATLSLFSVSLWVPQIFHFSNNYPILQHSFSMMSGFVLCFIFGFLMTAIPRFTGTFAATKFETNLLIVLIILSQFFSFINIKISYLLTIVAILSLISFLYKRFRLKKNSLPSYFIFIPCYFFTTLVGISLMLFGTTFMVGKKIFYYGSTDYLILGLGSMLIPALLGTKPLPTDKDFKVVNYSEEIVILVVLMALLIFSNILFIFSFPKSSYSLKLAVNLFFAYKFWRLFKIPTNLKWFKFCLWLAAWVFILSPVLMVIYPYLSSHMIHLNFISGISLITFTIGSHVILSHGKHAVDKEKRKLFFLFFFFIIFSTALVRVFAIIFPNSYILHLGIAAIFWCLGVLFWIYKIGIKIWQ